MTNQDKNRSAHIINKALRVIDFHLRYCSLKVEATRAPAAANKRNSNYGANLYQLSSASPFVSFRQLIDDIGQDVGRCIFWCLVCMMRLFIVVHFWLMASLHYRYDRLRDNLWPPSDVHASLVCSNQSDLIDTSSDAFKSFTNLENWVYYCGSLLPGLRGVSSICFVLAASTCVCNDILAPAVMHFRKQRVDIYGFIRDKQAERIRFLANLNSLVASLFTCKRINLLGTTLIEYRAKGRLNNRHHFRLMANYSRRSGFQSCYVRNSGRLLNQTRPLASDSFTIATSELSLVDELAARPAAHLSDWWHERVCHLCANLSRFGFVAILLIGSLFLIVNLLMEIGLRIDYRLKLVNCQWRNQSISSVSRVQPLRLAELESVAQLDAYRAHDGSLSSSISLYWIETKLYLTWREFVVLCEVFALLAGSSISLPLYTGLYLGQYISKMLWLGEIRAQVKGCIAAGIGRQVETDEAASCKQRNELLRSLTVAYLNFELFRREQRSYQSMANFLLGQMTLMNAQSLLISYLVGSVLDRADDRMSMLLTTYVFSLLNVYLVTSAIRTSMALKLMKDISRMVAFVAGRSLQCSFVATLWAQQMLTRQETLDCFAPKLLGLSITFDKIVTLNAYLVGLWYLALRA